MTFLFLFVASFVLSPSTITMTSLSILNFFTRPSSFYLTHAIVSSYFRIAAVLEANCIPRVLQLLAEVPEEAIQAPTLRIVGNCMSGSDTQTQAILDFGVLPILSSLLDNESRNIRKETCWTLSNITSGTVSQVQQVLESPGLFSRVIQMIDESSDDAEIQKEATWVVSNATSNREPNQIAYIIEQGAVGPLVALLKKRSLVLDIALEGLENILGDYSFNIYTHSSFPFNRSNVASLNYSYIHSLAHLCSPSFTHTHTFVCYIVIH